MRVREDYRSLSGTEKAAIFMMALSEEQTIKIFKEMDDEEILELSQVMSSLGKVNSDIIERLFIEFAESMSSTNALVGTLHIIQNILLHRLHAQHA